MLGMLIAYDAAGNVIATLDHLQARDRDGTPIGLVDFEGHEMAGGKLRAIWDVEGARGSGSWPEWIGARAHEFRVLLDRKRRIRALVHKGSGYTRTRAGVEAAIRAVAPDEDGARDIRHLVGGPGAALILDASGRTAGTQSTA
jgi:hypothetical protein